MHHSTLVPVDQSLCASRRERSRRRPTNEACIVGSSVPMPVWVADYMEALVEELVSAEKIIAV